MMQGTGRGGGKKEESGKKGGKREEKERELKVVRDGLDDYMTDSNGSSHSSSSGQEEEPLHKWVGQSSETLHCCLMCALFQKTSLLGHEEEEDLPLQGVHSDVSKAN